MLQTVLAGTDPSQPAIDQLTGQPLTIEELLRRRGLLAVGGNSRMMPLGNATQLSTPAVAASASGVSGSNGGLPSPVAATDIPVDPNTVPVAAAPVVAPTAIMNDTQKDTNDLEALLAGAGVAAGSVAAAALLNRMRKGKQGNPGDNVNMFGEEEGSLRDPISPRRKLADSMNTDGAAAAQRTAQLNDSTNSRYNTREETVAYSDVGPENRVATTLADRKRLAASARSNATSSAGPARLNSATVNETRDAPRLNAPPRGLPARGPAALPDYYVPGARTETRAEIGARQSVQSRVLPDAPPMASGDAYSDIPKPLLSQLRNVAQVMAQNRAQGRNAQRNRSGNLQRRAGAPTADPGVEGILNSLVARIRQDPSLATSLRRVRLP
jgi:hypothetical protein